MHAQLDNRWDLHVKISEAPSTTFINVRPLFFFLFFLRDEQIFLYVRDKQGFFPVKIVFCLGRYDVI